MHVHCLQLLMSTGLLFQSAFCWPYKSMTGEMVPMEGSNLAMGTWYGSPLSMYIYLGLVVEYWRFVGTCTHHSYSKLFYLCNLASLFKFLPPPSPPIHLHVSSVHPLIYAGPILMNSKKNHQILVKISHYLIARLVALQLIDN